MHDGGHAARQRERATPAGGVKAEIEATLKNSGHAYWKKNDPGHAAAVERMRRLHEMAYPEETN